MNRIFKHKRRHWLNASLLLVSFLGLPLAGLALAGRDVSPFLQFPPLQWEMDYTSFHPIIYWAYWGLVALLILIWFSFNKSLTKVVHREIERRHNFPWWGWLGLGLGMVCWILAWNRFAWFAPWQEYTFTPLWLSFITTVNALIFRKLGHCTLLQRPLEFLMLFLTSAAFWWFFEYLNRFVQNWHYLGLENILPIKYFFHGSLCFSTVLPAVYSAQCYLRTIPALERLAASGPALSIRFEAEVAVLVLLAVFLAFFFIGLKPELLFPILWAGPLAGWVALNRLTGTPVCLGGIGQGNWSYVFNWALAALLCGFFWEMWNFLSLAKWTYKIPSFDVLKIFEMPLAGYCGYLTFGLQCALAAEAVLGPGPGFTARRPR